MPKELELGRDRNHEVASDYRHRVIAHERRPALGGDSPPASIIWLQRPILAYRTGREDNTQL
jgi:hypothetical protein